MTRRFACDVRAWEQRGNVHRGNWVPELPDDWDYRWSDSVRMGREDDDHIVEVVVLSDREAHVELYMRDRGGWREVGGNVVLRDMRVIWREAERLAKRHEWA